jgi:hypothetical protein
MTLSRTASPIFDWPPEEDDDLSITKAKLQDLLAGERVESLTVRIRSSEAQDLQPLVDVIAEAPRPALRQLVFAEFGEPLGDWFDHGEPYDYCWAPLGDLSRLWQNVPALEELTLQGLSMALGSIDLGKLKTVAIRGTLSSANLHSVTAARWPNVERLEIFFGDPELGAEGSMEDVLPLLAGEGLPHIRHLGLKYCGFIDEIVERLDRMAFLPRLRSLDLSMSDLSREGEENLYAQRKLLSHLEVLRIDEHANADWIHEE